MTKRKSEEERAAELLRREREGRKVRDRVDAAFDWWVHHHPDTYPYPVHALQAWRAAWRKATAEAWSIAQTWGKFEGMPLTDREAALATAIADAINERMHLPPDTELTK